MIIDIITGYIFFLFVLSCHHFYIFRKRMNYLQEVRELQEIMSKAILPTIGLDLTNGEETPESELDEEQLFYKKIANKYGFKVKKL